MPTKDTAKPAEPPENKPENKPAKVRNKPDESKPVETKPAAEPKPDPHNFVEVECRRAVPCGARTFQPGEKVALVQMPEGVDFNWFVDACRNGFLRPCE